MEKPSQDPRRSATPWNHLEAWLLSPRFLRGFWLLASLPRTWSQRSQVLNLQAQADVVPSSAVGRTECLSALGAPFGCLPTVAESCG